MDPITTGIGALALAYGIFSGIMRFVKPGMFKKLEPMKQRFGATAGSLIHFVFYVIVPVVAGVVFIAAGLSGESFFSATK